MNEVERHVADLSDRLLERERAIFDGMRASAEAWWQVAARDARKRWQRGRVRNRQAVIDGWVRDATAMADGLTSVSWLFLSDAMDLTWTCLVNELHVVERHLGKKYVGTANVGLNRVSKTALLTSAQSDVRQTFLDNVGVFAGAVPAVVGEAVTSGRSALEMQRAVLPLWMGLVRSVDLRRIEFEMVNAVRGEAMQRMDEAAESR